MYQFVGIAAVLSVGSQGERFCEQHRVSKFRATRHHRTLMRFRIEIGRCIGSDTGRVTAVCTVVEAPL